MVLFTHLHWIPLHTFLFSFFLSFLSLFLFSFCWTCAYINYSKTDYEYYVWNDDPVSEHVRENFQSCDKVWQSCSKSLENKLNFCFFFAILHLLLTNDTQKHSVYLTMHIKESQNDESLPTPSVVCRIYFEIYCVILFYYIEIMHKLWACESIVFYI